MNQGVGVEATVGGRAALSMLHCRVRPPLERASVTRIEEALQCTLEVLARDRRGMTSRPQSVIDVCDANQ
jgi:hypothetical protein